MEKIKEHRLFGGSQQVWRHESATTGCAMEFAAYLPPQVADGKCPALFYLSGLTCTWANATEKAGAQQLAARRGFILLMPDTSPRGLNLPGEDDAYDFGSGAGFYVNAARAPWRKNYRMFDYVCEELPALAQQHLPVDGARLGVFGHSMGGHGALICALKRPDLFKTCSAFAPICAPMQCPWGRKAFGGYLGDDESAWRAWDACALLEDGATKWRGAIRADFGGGDEFLKEQLRPDLLRAACEKAGVPLTAEIHDGYDHSYYFIASLMEAHIDHHAAGLDLVE